MNHTHTIGRISELAFARHALELGLGVFEPIGTERFDLLIGIAGDLRRVQVKTGRVRNGAVQFKSCSNAEGVGRPRHYDDDADDIGIFVPDLEQCYLLSIQECPRGGGVLRVDAPRNGQVARVRWAVDYELKAVVASRASRRLPIQSTPPDSGG